MLDNFEKEITIKNSYIKIKKPEPFTPIEQLLYVLPKTQLSLIPKEDEEKINYPIENDFGITYQWAFCRYFWESHVDLPEINIDELEDFIHSNEYLWKNKEKE